MKTSDFDYSLPLELIAQTPIEPRDQSRLMVLNRSDSSIEHRKFFEITDYLRAGDVLLFNDSRVIPARLNGRKIDSGGRVEILLLRRLDTCAWETLVKPGKRVNIGTMIEITNDSVVDNRHEAKVLAKVIELRQGGIKVISFSDETLLPKLGKIPLPPYIHTPLTRPGRYQTVYASEAGSVAAPTAGLHFTPELLSDIERKGVHCLFVTLHIGLDTFRPVREDDPLEHPIYREYGGLRQEVASQLSQARAENYLRWHHHNENYRAGSSNNNAVFLEPFEGWVSLFILPGYQFRVVDALITNLHLPKSTLLMLVTAFAGKDFINRAYEEAIALRYRFYSFGHCMLIL